MWAQRGTGHVARKKWSLDATSALRLQRASEHKTSTGDVYVENYRRARVHGNLGWYREAYGKCTLFS